MEDFQYYVISEDGDDILHTTDYLMAVNRAQNYADEVNVSVAVYTAIMGQPLKTNYVAEPAKDFY